MQKILLQGIFVKLDIRINSNQKFWAEAEQTTSLNSYCNTWIEGEWFKNLLTQKYFTKKVSYLKVFWPKIVLNQNFVWKMWRRKKLLKKHLKWFWMKKFVAQNMRVMKFVAHKVVFRTISPLLRIMWQKLVSDFEDEVSHKVQSWVKNVSYNVGNSLRTRGGLQFVAHKVILFLSVRFCETCNKNPW